MAEFILEANDLTERYSASVGLEGLDLALSRGEIFGILGPNGSGKTTTIRRLLDPIRPTRGNAHLFAPPTRDPRSAGRNTSAPFITSGRCRPPSLRSCRFRA